jgi:adenylate cyclase class IV
LSNARRNLELKIRCTNLSRAQEAVRRLGAQPGGVEVQTDTFFRVPHGRLKLRQIDSQPAVLISYYRPDQQGVRCSAYRLVPVPDPAALEAALSSALGARGRVCKRRAIYFWHNVRIHLDEVTGLGTFIEFEAVLSDMQDEAASQARLAELCRVLAVEPADSLATSYADLMGI